MTPRLLALVALALPLGACKGVDPAPTELDGLFHFTWDKFEAGDDEELAEAARNLHTAVDGDTLTDAIDGTLSDMSAAQVEAVGRTDVDPAAAQGLYMARSFSCDLDTLALILTAANQDELYEGEYDAYERDYDGDTDAFLDGSEPTLSWDLSYEVSVAGATYIARSKGGLRQVAGLEAELLPHGPVLIGRTYMKEPAEFPEGSNKVQDQDFQIEAFWARGSSEVVHVYGMWRHADYGSGVNTDNESFQRLMLNGMAKWDDDTEKLCEEGW